MAAEVATLLLQDPLVDGKGASLSEEKRDANIRRLVKSIRSIKAQDVPQQIQGQPLTELLDPHRNTIGYLAALLAYAQQAVLAQQVGLVSNFLASFDSIQARYVGPELQQLLTWLFNYYDHSKDGSVVPYFASAILRLDPDSSTFTSAHLLLVRLCLAAGLPRQALPVLDKDIYDFPTDPQKNVDERFPCADHQDSATFITKSSDLSAPLSPSDVHEYYLLGAQVYIGLRQFDRARLFLELVLASPSQGVATPLMVEAYKRLLLVNLLTTGYSDLPDNTQVYKTCLSLSRAYKALADNFKRRDIARFHAELDAGAAIWDEDGNTAIVDQVAESLRRYRVIDLQKTYSALPVDRIAVHLSLDPPTTTTLLNTMIAEGAINALLPPAAPGTSAPPVLRFLSHNPNTPAVDHDVVLQEKYAKVEQLAKHVREADRRLALQREYVDFVRRNKRADAAGASGFEDPMDVWDGPETGDQDEDMMADL